MVRAKQGRQALGGGNEAAAMADEGEVAPAVELVESSPPNGPLQACIAFARLDCTVCLIGLLLGRFGILSSFWMCMTTQFNFANPASDNTGKLGKLATTIVNVTGANSCR